MTTICAYADIDGECSRNVRLHDRERRSRVNHQTQWELSCTRKTENAPFAPERDAIFNEA